MKNIFLLKNVKIISRFASIQIVGRRVNSLFSRANTAFGSTGVPVPTGSGVSPGSGSGSGASPAEFVWNPSSASGLDSTNSNPSPPQNLQVTNIGGSAGTPGAISLTGADASRFEILTNECTSSLAVNAGCNVIVRALPGLGATYILLI